MEGRRGVVIISPPHTTASTKAGRGGTCPALSRRPLTCTVPALSARAYGAAGPDARGYGAAGPDARAGQAPPLLRRHRHPDLETRPVRHRDDAHPSLVVLLHHPLHQREPDP